MRHPVYLVLRRMRSLSIPLALALGSCSGSETRALALGQEAQEEAQAGDIAGARRTVAKAILERDDIADLYLLKGQLELRAKAYLEAYGSFNQVLTLDAANVQALRIVAQLALTLGEISDAETNADRLLLINPTDPTARFIKGMVLLSHRNPDGAQQLADKLLAANSADPLGAVLLARVLYFRGKTAEAIKVLEPVRNDSSQSELVERTLIGLYRETNQPAKLIEALRKFIATRPDDTSPRIELANVFYKSANRDAARSAAADALAEPKVDASTVDQIVTLWLPNDRDPFPDSSWRRLKSELPLATLARYYLLSGDTRKASEIASTVASDDGQALRLRIAMQASPSEAVARQVEGVLARDKTQCDALVAKAIFERSTGAIAPAIRDGNQAVSECPNDTGAVLELAAAYRAQSDTAGEFHVYDQSLDRDPQNFAIAEAYVQRAIAARDTARAVSVGRRFTRSAPAVTQGWSLLLKACQANGDGACVANAQQGLAHAREDLSLDPRPGAPGNSSPIARLTK